MTNGYRGIIIGGALLCASLFLMVSLLTYHPHDPNGVLIELNFTVADEPKGAVGPDDSRTYIPGEF